MDEPLSSTRCIEIHLDTLCVWQFYSRKQQDPRRTILKKLLLSLLFSALIVPALFAAGTTGVTKPIKQFIDGFNTGDTKSAFAAYAAGEITIIDEFAPHLWQGTHAPQDWAAAYDKHSAATGVSDGNVTYGAPIVSNIEGDAAYVIIPTVYNYKEKGTAITEPGKMAFVLHLESGEWKIRAWTWTGTRPHAVNTAK